MKIYSSQGDRFASFVAVVGAVSGATGVGAHYAGGMAFVVGAVALLAVGGAMCASFARYDLMRDAPAPQVDDVRPLPTFAMAPQSDAAPATPLAATQWSSKQPVGAPVVDPAFLAQAAASRQRPTA